MSHLLRSVSSIIVLLLCLLQMGGAGASATWLKPSDMALREVTSVEGSGDMGARHTYLRDALSGLTLAEQLETAHYLQYVGEYEKAIEACEVLLESAPKDSVERKEAAFLLGKTQYHARNHTEAIKALLGFAEDYPDDARQSQAIFLAGRSYQAVGNWSLAIAQYQTFLSMDDTVASFVYE